MNSKVRDIFNVFDKKEKKQLVIFTENGELAEIIARNAGSRRVFVFETKSTNKIELLLNKIRTFDIEDTIIYLEKVHRETENAEKLKKDGYIIEELD